MVSIHFDDTHLHSFNTMNSFVFIETLWAPGPSRYIYPAKTIGYSQLVFYSFLFIYSFIYIFLFLVCFADFGARHQWFPLEEIVFIWMILIALEDGWLDVYELAENSSILRWFDRSWLYMKILWWNRLWYPSYPLGWGVTYLEGGGCWGGGGVELG